MVRTSMKTIPHGIAKLDERKHIANFDVGAKALKGGTAKKSVTNSDPAGQALAVDAGNHGPASDDPKDANLRLKHEMYNAGHYD